MRRVVICMAVLCAGALLAPATASAQTGIAGVVRDTTGAIMPGVTVEASSPALIEKSRRGDQRQRGPVQDRRPAARHIYRHVHARGVQDGEARRHPARRDVHGPNQRRAPGWRDGRDADGHRGVADRGRDQQHGDVCREPRCARRHSDDPARHHGARAADSRHDGDAVRARPVQPHQPRLGRLRTSRWPSTGCG